MIKKATITDSISVAELANLLWPHHEIDELDEEFKQLICSENAACFVYYDETVPVGFAQCELRRDYVEGTESIPVGYLEGIYVRSEYRMKGIAKELLFHCEQWAKSLGCSEFASDCELHNTESFKFHLNAGFEEANRIICFTKKLC
ncbi:aminoglycoside 6'-N-acetyltransferase [Clostridium manihotivorum]|uniref:Aminoglycoside N(6')-acetyltransferase type 1 n=1 Tax=Clostridium manihotivorum TaxID=2320868 RepID=A0A410DWN9_9CLOT|nr:aminoglycoside 6'-N-acetyltransferase [Clostridium manihotivorum]QAA33477.1 GNAT family N-acetyltransferase [Clostridium manihotivorum]